MAITPLPDVPRKELARIFNDPRTLRAIEAVFDNAAIGIPETVEEAQQAANDAQTAADGAQTAADAAQTAVTGVAGAPFVTFGASADLSNERVLTGATGVTFDVSAPGLIQVIVNVLTILGYTPANKAGDTFTGPVDVQALLQCDNLRIDQVPAASVTAASHALPVSMNGTTYYVKLSATP